MLWHDLDLQFPAREVTVLDGIEQIALRTFTIFGDDGFCFIVHQVFDALLTAEVEFDPETLVIGVDKTEGMAAETVHMTVGFRQAAVAEVDGQLVQ
ncbi:hypothetical protein D3C80_1706010 [compost metagenome]